MNHDFIWGQDNHLTFDQALIFALYRASETGRRQRVFKQKNPVNISEKVLPWVTEEVSGVRMYYFNEETIPDPA